MSMSVERLYSRQCPKSITGDPIMFRKSVNPMTGEDVLGILGQIQHRQPIGALILDAQIAQNVNARARLVSALNALFQFEMKKPAQLAFSMAEAAVHEVVDTCICNKCHGTGQVFSRKFSKFFECSVCSGVGRIIMTEKQIVKSINLNLSEPISAQNWQKNHYDHYMKAVDTLHRHAADAGRCAREILDCIVD